MFCTILSGDCRRTHSADRLFGPEEGELCPRGSFAGSVLYLNVIGARNLAAFVLESIVSALGSFSRALARAKTGGDQEGQGRGPHALLCTLGMGSVEKPPLALNPASSVKPVPAIL